MIMPPVVWENRHQWENWVPGSDYLWKGLIRSLNSFKLCVGNLVVTQHFSPEETEAQRRWLSQGHLPFRRRSWNSVPRLLLPQVQSGDEKHFHARFTPYPPILATTSLKWPLPTPLKTATCSNKMQPLQHWVVSLVARDGYPWALGSSWHLMLLTVKGR